VAEASEITLTFRFGHPSREPFSRQTFYSQLYKIFHAAEGND